MNETQSELWFQGRVQNYCDPANFYHNGCSHNEGKPMNFRVVLPNTQVIALV